MSPMKIYISFYSNRERFIQINLFTSNIMNSNSTVLQLFNKHTISNTLHFSLPISKFSQSFQEETFNLQALFLILGAKSTLHLKRFFISSLNILLTIISILLVVLSNFDALYLNNIYNFIKVLRYLFVTYVSKDKVLEGKS